MRLLLITLLTTSVFAQTDWELKKEKDDIKVYIANSDETKIKQFKVETFVNASPREIANAVVDLENNYKWFVNVEKAELIEELNKNTITFKQVVQVPFPFKNREVVAQSTVKELGNGLIRIELMEAPNAIPENEDYVRMLISRGYWQLTPSGNGTAVEYSFLSDPGGDIPAWIVNQFIVSTPFKTIKGLREYLDK